jgi:nucleotide-binding universal stress UspA family protein
MHRFRQLAVGLNLTAADAGIIRYAVLFSRLGSVQHVRFVHVLPQTAASPHLVERDRVLKEMQSETAKILGDALSSIKVTHDAVTGPLTDRLLTYVAEEQVDLLLVGQGGGQSGRRALARRLAMKAPCSLWMVPDGSPAAIRRVLVPIDFSDHAEDTLRVALDVARLCGAVCVPLHVYFNAAVVTFEGYDRILRGEEAQAYKRFVAPLDCQDVEVTPLFEEGANVAHVIRRVAARLGADLIVMGTRGRSRSAAILLGSVTEETIMETNVPLLAVKHFGARLSVLQALLDRRFIHRGELHTD